MEPTIIVEALGLSAVVLASLLDLRGLERQAATRRARARQTREASRCPFCHRGFEEGDAVLPCEGCGARHHTECWAESPRCGIYGCTARAPLAARAAEEAAPPAAEEPLSAAEEPLPAADGPLPAAEEPLSAAEEPLSAAEEPLSAAFVDAFAHDVPDGDADDVTGEERADSAPPAAREALVQDSPRG